jgi:hypothetical protein
MDKRQMRRASPDVYLLAFSNVCEERLMSSHLAETNQTDYTPPQVEGDAGAVRPEEPCIYGLFPALVRGVNVAGEPFHARTVLDNFSAGEFSLALAQCVEIGGELFVVTEIHDATVALHGTVVRLEPQADGSCRLIVSITHHRFV